MDIAAAPAIPPPKARIADSLIIIDKDFGGLPFYGLDIKYIVYKVHLYKL